MSQRCRRAAGLRAQQRAGPRVAEPQAAARAALGDPAAPSRRRCDCRSPTRDLRPTAVEPVAQHRVTDVGQVHANLMRAAGHGMHVQGREAGESLLALRRTSRLRDWWRGRRGSPSSRADADACRSAGQSDRDLDRARRPRSQNTLCRSSGCPTGRPGACGPHRSWPRRQCPTYRDRADARCRADRHRPRRSAARSGAPTR